MTTDIAALIAEARQFARAAYLQDSTVHSVIARLADALESLTAPATDDEREEIARIIRDADDKAYAESGWFAALPTEVADAILAAGFRRSARVPVSRDELAEFIAQWMADDHNGFGSCNAPRDMASDILATHDIFPKADRKPADVGPDA